MRIPIGRAIRQICDAQTLRFGTVVALASEWGAHHVIIP
jgi:hypothetical protein